MLLLYFPLKISSPVFIWISAAFGVFDGSSILSSDHIYSM
jgi:hypothetical protein